MNDSPLIFFSNTPCVCPPGSRNPADFLHFLSKHQQAVLVAAGIWRTSHWCGLELKTNAQAPWKMPMQHEMYHMPKDIKPSPKHYMNSYLNFFIATTSNSSFLQMNSSLHFTTYKINHQCFWKLGLPYTQFYSSSTEICSSLPLVMLSRCPKYQESRGQHFLRSLSNLQSHKTIHISPFPDFDIC